MVRTMDKLEVFLIPAFDDNYIFVLRNKTAQKTAVIDPALAQPVVEFLEDRGWTLDEIWNTHHHPDHIGGNLALLNEYKCKARCLDSDKDRIPGHTQTHFDNDTFEFGATPILIKEVFGHTLGHICFWIESHDILFIGDTLFAMGCGRLFEGSPAQMWKSLSWIKQLAPQTKVYCAHEYTLANAEFALSVEPNNKKLIERINEEKAKRSNDSPTIPTTISKEIETNPFLRPHSSEIKKNLSMNDAEDEAVFAKLRQLKDKQ